MPRRVNPKDRIIVNIPEYDGAGIYRIENIRTGKAYVGSSVNIKQRIKAHDQAMRTGNCNLRFLEDIKRGDKFRVTIIEKMGIPTRHEMYERENYYIEKENLYREGYNTAGVHDYDMKLEEAIGNTYGLAYMNQPMVSTTRKRKKPDEIDSFFD